MQHQSFMTNHRATFLAPVVPVAADLPIHEVPYSPALLLPLPAFTSTLVCHEDFVAACEFGYDDYFDSLSEMISGEGDKVETYVFRFTYQSMTLDEVYTFLAENTAPDGTTLSWRIGFGFGWLSALAKYQPKLAKKGLSFLLSLAKQGRPNA